VSQLLSLEFWSLVGVVVGIYTIFSAGLQLQFGFTGLLNFGHVASMAVGAYTMAILVVKADMSLWLASAVAIVAGMVFGAVLGLPALRLRIDYFAITTIAIGEIVRYVALNAQSLTGGPLGTSNLAGPTDVAQYNGSWIAFREHVQGWLGHIVGSHAGPDFTMLVIVWLVAIASLALLTPLVRSPWGRVLRAIRDDQDAAASLGKPVLWYKLQALAIGSGFGALAGLLYAFEFQFFSPTDFAPTITFYAWLIVLLGGTARLWAVPVGAFIFGLIFAGTRFFNFKPFSYLDPAQLAYLRLMVIGAILIALMAWRPQGLFGKREEMVLE
jgi:ABC-type branched-subunit amino acid transport system permease subunit